MIGELIGKLDAVSRLNRAIRTFPSQAAAARHLGIAPPHLNQMLGGLRPLHPALLRLAGIEHAERYRVVGEIISKSANAPCPAPVVPFWPSRKKAGAPLGWFIRRVVHRGSCRTCGGRGWVSRTWSSPTGSCQSLVPCHHGRRLPPPPRPPCRPPDRGRAEDGGLAKEKPRHAGRGLPGYAGDELR